MGHLLHLRRSASASTRRSTATSTRSAVASRSGWCWSTSSPVPDQVLLLDEPDNFLDVPGKVWLEGRIRESPKTILFISHDRELLANTATRVVTVELARGGQSAGNSVWTHPGGFASYHQARRDRFARFEELRRRWDEEHAKLKALVLRYKHKADVQRRAWPRVPRRPDPAAQVRGGRAADRAAARAAGDACGSRAVAPASVRWSARSSS